MAEITFEEVNDFEGHGLAVVMVGGWRVDGYSCMYSANASKSSLSNLCASDGLCKKISSGIRNAWDLFSRLRRAFIQVSPLVNSTVSCGYLLRREYNISMMIVRSCLGGCLGGVYFGLFPKAFELRGDGIAVGGLTD